MHDDAKRLRLNMYFPGKVTIHTSFMVTLFKWYDFPFNITREKGLGWRLTHVFAKPDTVEQLELLKYKLPHMQ